MQQQALEQQALEQEAFQVNLQAQQEAFQVILQAQQEALRLLLQAWAEEANPSFPPWALAALGTSLGLQRISPSRANTCMLSVLPPSLKDSEVVY